MKNFGFVLVKSEMRPLKKKTKRSREVPRKVGTKRENLEKSARQKAFALLKNNQKNGKKHVALLIFTGKKPFSSGSGVERWTEGVSAVTAICSRSRLSQSKKLVQFAEESLTLICFHLRR